MNLISELPSRRLFNYACLQALVNNNAYMDNQLYQFEKHPKSICTSVQSHYFEVHDVMKYARKHRAFSPQAHRLHLLTIMFTWKTSCISLKNIRNLFVQAYKLTIEAYAKNICYTRGAQIIVHVCKQPPFPCDVIRRHEDKGKG